MKLFRQKQTYISEQTRLTGDIESDADVAIDGWMRGNVVTQRQVTLGATARFEGNIESDTVLISGRFEGTVVARRLIEVRIPADIVGDLISDAVRVESGVAIQGKVCAKTIQSDAPQAATAGCCVSAFPAEQTVSTDDTVAVAVEREEAYATTEGDRDYRD